ncbi:4Fe-4S dicluster domain-containing protein [Desulfitobacterium sp. Sab5]|uniref:4Fe-4S dicluster domain-containing protein n=1 Tax=Desulfitobacterium nosdiversum TaxID=3375356 RepID=UPI003CF103AB
MSTNKRLGLVIDMQRCIGCWTCAVSCKTENNVGLGNWWNRVLSPSGQQEQFGMPTAGPDGQPEISSRPYACMHCKNAPCVKACPTGATYKRPDGITAQDYSKCIGCRMCMAACPYNVRVFNWGTPVQVPTFEDDHVGNADVPKRSKGVVEKCTFCVERTDKGELPTCVAGCPAHARTFGDLNDPNSEVSKLISERGGETFKDEFGTEPSVYYLPRRRRQSTKSIAMSQTTSLNSTGAALAAKTPVPPNTNIVAPNNTVSVTNTPKTSEPTYQGNCCIKIRESDQL